jgi:acetyltransferase-like isoleucine patch superfamily enzyme
VVPENPRSRLLLWLQRQAPLPQRLRQGLLRRAGIDVGPGALIYPHLTVLGSHHLKIGANSFLNAGCYLETHADVTIGCDVAVADDVRLLTSTHEIGRSGRRAGQLTSAPVSIGDGSWLGSGVRVLPGVSVANGCVIAAGAVVAADTEPDGLYAGVPAERVRDL